MGEQQVGKAKDIISSLLALLAGFLFFFGYSSLPPVPTGADEPGLNLSIWDGAEWVPYANWMVEGGNYCYQESATISNQSGVDNLCNQDYSGAYNFASTGGYLCTNPPGNYTAMYDGDWDTGCLNLGNGNITMWVNYTKPDGLISAENVTWTIGYLTVPEENVSVDPVCFSQDMLQFKIHQVQIGVDVDLYGSCYNGTAWVGILYVPDIGGYTEEAISWYGEDNQMAFRCSNPPSICQPTNQDNETTQAILRNHNNGSANSTSQQIKSNTNWSTAELRCGTSVAGPSANTNVTTVWTNYSVSQLDIDATQDIYCFLDVTSVPADFPRDFNLTVRNN